MESRAASSIDSHQFASYPRRVPTRLELRPAGEDRSAAAPCCEPLASEPLDAEGAERLSLRLKALADPARLRLVSMLLAAPDGEACTCDLVEPLGLSQPTVTHHLKVLEGAGLVTGERRGRWTFYRVRRDELEAVRVVLAPS